MFCLLLLVRDTRKLLLTVTAFTVAHSITLTAATLGIVPCPAAPVEATIALSIVFLARELLSGEANRSGVTRSYPWVVAFSFGLLHGLGFASALAEIGLPQGEIPLALFAFNLGVELGQLAFIAAILAVWTILRRLAQSAPGWLRFMDDALPVTPLASRPPFRSRASCRRFLMSRRKESSPRTFAIARIAFFIAQTTTALADPQSVPKFNRSQYQLNFRYGADYNGLDITRPERAYFEMRRRTEHQAQQRGIDKPCYFVGVALFRWAPTGNSAGSPRYR